MKKIIPTLATVTLTGILVSCGAPKSVEPVAQDLPTATPKTQAVADEKVMSPDMVTPGIAEVSPVPTETATGANSTSSGSIMPAEASNTMTGSSDVNPLMP